MLRLFKIVGMLFGLAGLFQISEARMFKIMVSCYKCAVQADQEVATVANGWIPHSVDEGDSILMTQLCPKCHGFSVYQWLRDHPSQRFLNHVYARLNGYFWLPCPLCGEYFGGHEWDNHDGINKKLQSDGLTTYQGICNKCAARRRKP